MIKRLVDILASFFGLLFFSPILLPAIFLVWKEDKKSPFYVTSRLGKNEISFNMIKLRSMVVNADKSGVVSSSDNDIRITSIGHKIRKYKLDELVQLWNVLKGDMSLVGPRPLLLEYLPLYSTKQARRHEVKPGVTGWAQVNGRNTITWSEKFDLDVWYVDNQSIWLDIKILWLTVKKVIARSDINQDGQATMKKFKGNNAKS